MGLAKSLGQSCPSGSVHVAGAPACRQVVPEHRLMVLCEPPFNLGLGFCFLFYPFFLLGRVPGGSWYLQGEQDFQFVWWLPLGSLLDGCTSVMVPFGHRSPPFWWPLQWTTATSFGSQTASRSFRISAWVLIPFPSAVRGPLSLYKPRWTCRLAKA